MNDVNFSLPNVFGGIMCAFIAIMGIRVTYPFAEEILGFTWESNIMKVVATLIMWLIYVFVLWVLVWAKYFQPKQEVNQHG